MFTQSLEDIKTELEKNPIFPKGEIAGKIFKGLDDRKGNYFVLVADSDYSGQHIRMEDENIIGSYRLLAKVDGVCVNDCLTKLYGQLTKIGVSIVSMGYDSAKIYESENQEPLKRDCQFIKATLEISIPKTLCCNCIGLICEE